MIGPIAEKPAIEEGSFLWLIKLISFHLVNLTFSQHHLRPVALGLSEVRR